MTAQVNDIFLYEDIRYVVAGISEGEIFDPTVLGLEPVAMSTACYRGYRVCYALLDNQLIVESLYVNLTDKDGRPKVGPSINGIGSTEPKKTGLINEFSTSYEGLCYHLDYTGGILIANGFIRKHYVHMGFQLPWKYERVLELVFNKGVVTQSSDWSEKMAQFRRINLEDPEGKQTPSHAEIRRFIKTAFDRSYG